MPHNVLAPDGEVCEAHTCQTIISLSLSWRQCSSFRQEVGFVENRKYSWYHIYGWMSQCDKPLKHCVTFVWFLSYALTRHFIRYNLIRSMCTLWSGWCVYIHYIFLKYISRAQKSSLVLYFYLRKWKHFCPLPYFLGLVIQITPFLSLLMDALVPVHVKFVFMKLESSVASAVG